jgi:hypothetical protein
VGGLGQSTWTCLGVAPELAGPMACRIATCVDDQIASLIAIARCNSIRSKGKDLRLDIECKRAMFPRCKISWPGFLRFIFDAGA